jgi:cytochrome d ubiquinol oxidase subunit II
MDLNTLWFILIAVLYIGFFILEGFDFGVGMLLPFLSKGGGLKSVDNKRRTIINTIGPFWDGNEVWLLTAGGATFAAFPNWYATLFSGFYLPLFLILIALILRGVAFEFRSKHDDPTWRNVWDWCITIGSFLPAFLLGVAFANLVKGVPIDENMNYVGGFFNLLNFYALLGGVAAVLTFMLHGAIFLSLKTTGALMEKARKTATRLWILDLAVMLAFLASTYVYTDILTKLGINPGPIPIGGAATLLVAGYFIRKERDGWAFLMTVTTIAAAIITFFMILFPRVMISNIDPSYSLTIYNASSSPYTLRVMTIVALTFTPIVLLYQGWTYWVFRKRVEGKPETLTY